MCRNTHSPQKADEGTRPAEVVVQPPTRNKQTTHTSATKASTRQTANLGILIQYSSFTASHKIVKNEGDEKESSVLLSVSVSLPGHALFSNQADRRAAQGHNRRHKHTNFNQRYRTCTTKTTNSLHTKIQPLNYTTSHHLNQKPYVVSIENHPVSHQHPSPSTARNKPSRSGTVLFFVPCTHQSG